jgi:formate-dependent nitrite reductase membrane component NrfD
VLVLELVALVAFLLSLGPVARVFISGWGVVLLLGVVGLGILAPFLLERRVEAHGPRQLVQAAALVLVGGFLLRVVVLLSSEEIHVLGSGTSSP